MRFDKLLILDLDETLIFGTDIPLTWLPDFMVLGKFYIYKRPGLDSFLSAVAERFQLAVWTSATADYAHEVIARILPPTVKLEFAFCRENCTRRLHSEYNETHYVKNLNKLRKKGYRLEKVLVIDDSAEAYALNYGNVIPVTKYRGEQNDDELLMLLKFLEQIGSVEDVRKVEKRYWRQGTFEAAND